MRKNNTEKGFTLLEVAIALAIFAVLSLSLIGWQVNETKHAKTMEVATALMALDSAYYQINTLVGHIPIPKQTVSRTSDVSDTGYICTVKNVKLWADKVELPLFYGGETQNVRISYNGQPYLWFPTLEDFKKYVRQNNLHGALYRKFYRTECNFGDNYFSQGITQLQSNWCFNTALYYATTDQQYQESRMYAFQPNYGTRSITIVSDPNNVALACHLYNGGNNLDYYIAGSIYYVPKNQTQSPVIYKYYVPPQYLGQEKPTKYVVSLRLYPENPIICGSAVVEPLRKLWATPAWLVAWGGASTSYHNVMHFYQLPSRLIYNDCSSIYGFNPQPPAVSTEFQLSTTQLLLDALKNLLDPRVDFRSLAKSGIYFEFIVEQDKLTKVKIIGLDQEMQKTLQSLLAGKLFNDMFLLNNGQGYNIKVYDFTC